jgi:hypothetical protein
MAPRIRRDDRGLSEVLGSILVFALVVSVLATIQVSGVPALNERVEFEHNAGVQADVRGFASAVDTAAATGVDQPVDVKTGVRYPPRLFLVNPGPTAGTLATTGDDTVAFDNLRALDPDAGDFLDGSPTYTSTGLVYQPTYNVYTAAPETRYEYGVVYNVDDDGGVSVLDEGGLVSGSRISLTALSGELAVSGGDAVSFTAVPTSGPGTVVSVTDDGDPLTLTLETRLPAAVWRDVLADELDTDGADGGTDDGRYVTGVDCPGVADAAPCDGPLTITFEPGYTYGLRLAQVSLDGGAGAAVPAYVTTPGVAQGFPAAGGETSVLVRDRFNNPLAGVDVLFTASGATFAGPSGRTAAVTATTGEDGVATTTVVPDAGVTSATVTAEIDTGSAGNGNGSDPMTTSYVVTFVEAAVDDSASRINPADAGDLVLTTVTGPAGNEFTLTFENTGTTAIEVTDARLSFYFASKPGKSDTPASARLVSGSSQAVLTLRGGGEPLSTPLTVAGGTTATVTVELYRNAGATGSFSQANSDDFFVLSLTMGDETGTYFVAATP